MAKKKTILPSDVQNFATLLTRWSRCETSFFLRQFWRSFGMTEMQFYKRLWKAKEQIIDFDFPEIKKNLRRNRFMRNQSRLEGGNRAEKISVNFQGEESYPQKSISNAKESRRV